MEADKKNVLIVGSDDNACALTNKLKTYENIGKVFITNKDTDIRENDLTGLLKFVLENNINLTIPFSKLALNSDIASFFQANGQNIFAPSKKSAQIALNKIQGKKFLYKIHAQTSKFGIFDNTKQALEYLNTSSFPVIISTSDGNNKITCPTMTLACRFLSESIQFHGETDILIEDYVYGHNFTVYFITDGYSAIPFSVVGDYKCSNDKISTDILEKCCYLPDFKISQIVISQVQNIINSAIKSLEVKQCPYMGILGVECTLISDDKFYINEFIPYLRNCDAKAVLDSIDENLIQLFDSCINGFFSDEYTQIKTNNFCAISTTVFNKKANNKTVLTHKASTLNRAKDLLKEDIGNINLNFSA